MKVPTFLSYDSNSQGNRSQFAKRLKQKLHYAETREFDSTLGRPDDFSSRIDESASHTNSSELGTNLGGTDAGFATFRFENALQSTVSTEGDNNDSPSDNKRGNKPSNSGFCGLDQQAVAALVKACFSLSGRVLALIDLITDGLLLWTIFNLENRIPWLMAALVCCIVGPYGVSYSSILNIFARRRVFEKAEGLTVFKMALFLSPLGLGFSFFLELCDVFLQLWSVVNLLIFQQSLYEHNQRVRKFALSVGFGVAEWEGLSKQRTILQLFGESVPQSLIQTAVAFSLFGIVSREQSKELRETGLSLYISISMASSNVCVQLVRLYLESRAVKQGFFDYSRAAMNAQIDWSPFLHLFRQIKHSHISHPRANTPRASGSSMSGLRANSGAQYTFTASLEALQQGASQPVNEVNPSSFPRTSALMFNTHRSGSIFNETSLKISNSHDGRHRQALSKTAKSVLTGDTILDYGRMTIADLGCCGRINVKYTFTPAGLEELTTLIASIPRRSNNKTFRGSRIKLCMGDSLRLVPIQSVIAFAHACQGRINLTMGMPWDVNHTWLRDSVDLVSSDSVCLSDLDIRIAKNELTRNRPLLQMLIESGLDDQNLSIFTQLLRHGVNPNGTDSKGHNILHYCVLNGHIEHVKRLIALFNPLRPSSSPLVTNERIRLDIQSPAWDGRTPLFQAIRELARNKSDPDSFKKYSKMIDILLENSANPNWVSDRVSILTLALNHGLWRAATKLIYYGARLDRRDKAALTRAMTTEIGKPNAFQRWFDSFQELFEALFSRCRLHPTEVFDENGNNVLHLICMGKADARHVSYALKFCPEWSNIQNNDRDTPMFVALHEQNISLFGKLLEAQLKHVKKSLPTPMADSFVRWFEEEFTKPGNTSRIVNSVLIMEMLDPFQVETRPWKEYLVRELSYEALAELSGSFDIGSITKHSFGKSIGSKLSKALFADIPSTVRVRSSLQGEFEDSASSLHIKAEFERNVERIADLPMTYPLASRLTDGSVGVGTPVSTKTNGTAVETDDKISLREFRKKLYQSMEKKDPTKNMDGFRLQVKNEMESLNVGFAMMDRDASTSSVALVTPMGGGHGSAKSTETNLASAARLYRLTDTRRSTFFIENGVIDRKPAAMSSDSSVKSNNNNSGIFSSRQDSSNSRIGNENDNNVSLMDLDHSNKVDMISVIHASVIECLSTADLLTDLMVTSVLLSEGAQVWASLMILTLIAPYLVGYSALLTLLPHNAILTTTPMCLVYFFCVDLFFIVFQLFWLFYAILLWVSQMCGLHRYCAKWLNGAWIGDFTTTVLQRFFGMTHMKVSGLRRCRTSTQLLFESIPQIILQLRIFFYYRSRRDQINDGNNSDRAVVRELGGLESIVLSIGLGIAHLCIEGSIIYMEAKTVQTSVLDYAIVCLSGRVGWVPFLERFREINSDESNDDWLINTNRGRFGRQRSQRYSALSESKKKSSSNNSNMSLIKHKSPVIRVNYDSIGKHFFCDSLHFRLDYEFDDQTLNVFGKELLRILGFQTNTKRVPIVILGQKCLRAVSDSALMDFQNLIAKCDTVSVRAINAAGWDRLLLVQQCSHLYENRPKSVRYKKLQFYIAKQISSLVKSGDMEGWYYCKTQLRDPNHLMYDLDLCLLALKSQSSSLCVRMREEGVIIHNCSSSNIEEMFTTVAQTCQRLIDLSQISSNGGGVSKNHITQYLWNSGIYLNFTLAKVTPEVYVAFKKVRKYMSHYLSILNGSNHNITNQSVIVSYVGNDSRIVRISLDLAIRFYKIRSQLSMTSFRVSQKEKLKAEIEEDRWIDVLEDFKLLRRNFLSDEPKMFDLYSLDRMVCLLELDSPSLWSKYMLWTSLFRREREILCENQTIQINQKYAMHGLGDLPSQWDFDLNDHRCLFVSGLTISSNDHNLSSESFNIIVKLTNGLNKWQWKPRIINNMDELELAHASSNHHHSSGHGRNLSSAVTAAAAALGPAAAHHGSQVSKPRLRHIVSRQNASDNKADFMIDFDTSDYQNPPFVPHKLEVLFYHLSDQSDRCEFISQIKFSLRIRYFKRAERDVWVEELIAPETEKATQKSDLKISRILVVNEPVMKFDSVQIDHSGQLQLGSGLIGLSLTSLSDVLLEDCVIASDKGTSNSSFNLTVEQNLVIRGNVTIDCACITAEDSCGGAVSITVRGSLFLWGRLTIINHGNLDGGDFHLTINQRLLLPNRSKHGIRVSNDGKGGRNGRIKIHCRDKDQSKFQIERVSLFGAGDGKRRVTLAGIEKYRSTGMMSAELDSDPGTGTASGSDTSEDVFSDQSVRIDDDFDSSEFISGSNQRRKKKRSSKSPVTPTPIPLAAHRSGSSSEPRPLEFAVYPTKEPEDRTVFVTDGEDDSRDGHAGSGSTVVFEYDTGQSGDSSEDERSEGSKKTVDELSLTDQET